MTTMSVDDVISVIILILNWSDSELSASGKVLHVRNTSSSYHHVLDVIIFYVSYQKNKYRDTFTHENNPNSSAYLWFDKSFVFPSWFLRFPDFQHICSANMHCILIKSYVFDDWSALLPELRTTLMTDPQRGSVHDLETPWGSRFVRIERIWTIWPRESQGSSMLSDSSCQFTEPELALQLRFTPVGNSQCRSRVTWDSRSPPTVLPALTTGAPTITSRSLALSSMITNKSIKYEWARWVKHEHIPECSPASIRTPKCGSFPLVSLQLLTRHLSSHGFQDQFNMIVTFFHYVRVLYAGTRLRKKENFLLQLNAFLLIVATC